MATTPKNRGSRSPRGARGDGPSVRGTSRHTRPQRNTVYTKKRRKPRGVWARFGINPRRVLIGLVKLGLIGAVILAGVLYYLASTLPDIRTLDTSKKQRGITVETEAGDIVATYGDVYGAHIPYEKLPKHLIQAVTATEDRRFFKHHGIDVWGIARAMVVNARAGRMVQGGSTITQQLAKNVFLTPERSLSRKAQEAMLALALEARYSKQEILSIYLNRVYLGAGVYGIDGASRRYFGKPATQLNLLESAMMAGLLKAPSRFAPTVNKQRALKRAHQVLINMADAGAITEAAIKPALRLPFGTGQIVEGGDVRYFTDWVVDQLPEYLGNVEEDVIVTTTFDPQLQRFAQDALQQVMATEGPGKNATQAALVSMAPSGAVRAMVGGVNYFSGQFNRAAQARRQPGSVFKLFVYLAALEAGLTPYSTVVDAPISLKVAGKEWTPENFTENFKGEIPMVQALRESLNTVSVRLSQYAGVGRVASMAERLGIPNVRAHPSIALGAVEASLLEMTTAYAHLASYGEAVKPYAITRIRTQSGKEIYVREAPGNNPVLASGTVEMMNYMLLDAVRQGTGTRAFIPGRDVAGKTGTSQNFKDAWFIGFTPQLVTGVWVGNDNNRSMKRVTGGSLPAQIWHDFMTPATADMPATPIPNDAARNDGLLPWLFGEDSPLPDEYDLPTPEQNLPDDVPFEIKNDVPSSETRPEPIPGPRSPTAKESSSDDVLPDNFLDDLIGILPEGKVEYEYPSER